MRQKILRLLLFLAGKLGSISSTSNSWRDKYIACLEADIVELRVEKVALRDIISRSIGPVPEEVPDETVVLERGPIRVRDWRHAKKFLVQRSRDRVKKMKDPVHREAS
jgi:hypothetical protein